MELTKKEISVLQETAKKYMEYASLPIQKEKITLWKALNRSKMERPMVVIDQIPWNEMNDNHELDLFVDNPVFRRVELNLKKEIYKFKHYPVDMVLDPFIRVPKAISNTGYGMKVEEETLYASGNVSSHVFKNQLATMEDAKKIKDMIVTHDEQETKRRYETANEVFDGIAPVEMEGTIFHLGVWDHLSQFMGVENIYFDLVDEPEKLHLFMERMTTSVIKGIEQVNQLKIYDTNANVCHCSYIYTDELLPDSGMGKETITKYGWAFGLAQLFSSVSPGVTEEFELPYIKRMAEYFGMIYYGCCDRLDDRLDLVLTIPHLKKVSCSPWSIREAFAEKIGPKVIMSNKPTPALVATASLDEEEIRKDLQRTVDAARKNNVNLEMILKDISTVKCEPQRLTRWAEIAMDVVNNY
ncbi:MAG TPA: hypothetical protein PLT91_02180 [Clostridia bacterium]|jgi:hypothetical protein|nr:MAG: hypothetical protein BWX97_01176 [Firmicutes bacterium ADurb.Bin146]HOD93172.1 hypothetical protein [Clostridia bacterium]HQM39031.1 hypothetical protein [Clostridia bacterium]